jgi:hypothetical protein
LALVASPISHKIVHILSVRKKEIDCVYFPKDAKRNDNAKILGAAARSKFNSYCANNGKVIEPNGLVHQYMAFI